MKNCYHKLVGKCISIIISIVIISGFIVTPAFLLNDAFNDSKTIDYTNWDTEVDRLDIVQNIIVEDIKPQKVQAVNTLKSTKTTSNSKTIETIAQIKLNDLVNTNYWSHTNSNGCSFNCRVNSYLVTRGGKYTWIGENLYRGICDVNNAYRLWRLSPTHNEILKHKSNKQVLIGYEFEPGLCYYVLVKAIIK
jgi:uncharacterized protein YkwD